MATMKTLSTDGRQRLAICSSVGRLSGLTAALSVSK
jgi:hypothetical protein